MTVGDLGTCSFCGEALDVHDLNFRFRFPDAVAEALDAGLDESEIAGDPRHDEVINVGDSWFIRVLLQVDLTDGARVTFGTWLEVKFDVLRSIAEIWSTPEYHSLSVAGRLANAVPPWGNEVLGATATATVTEMAHSPYITSSDDGLLSRVIDDDWPSEVVLAALPH
jgi:hypothetical protein